MKRGVMLVSVFYGCWSIIIIVGFGTSVGLEFSPVVDVFGAWLSKFMPIIDGTILLMMMDRVVNKKDQKGPTVDPSRASTGPARPAPVATKPALASGGPASQNPAANRPVVNANPRPSAPPQPPSTAQSHSPHPKPGEFIPPPLDIDVRICIKPMPCSATAIIHP